MASAYDHWLAVWVEQVDELLRGPLPTFPRRTLLPLLSETFDAVATCHEMGLDVRLPLETTRSLVLAQGGADFAHGQLEPAAAIQPLLMLVDRHVTAHGALSPAQSGQVAECGLTGRETACCGCSPRG